MSGGPLPILPQQTAFVSMMAVFGSSSIIANHIVTSLSDDMMTTMVRSTQFKAMASEPRLKILQLVAEPEKHFGHQHSADPAELGVCMTLIAEALAIAQPTASRHLDILRQAGFITVQRHLKWSYCGRNEAGIYDYLDWLRREICAKSTVK